MKKYKPIKSEEFPDYYEIRIFPDKRQYRFLSDEPWVDLLDINNTLLLNGTKKKVLLKDVWTNVVKEFDKLLDVANHLNVVPSVVTQYINQPNQPVLPGYVQIKLAIWRIVGDPYLELSGYTKRPHVQIINTITGKVRIIHKLSNAARIIGIKRTTLGHRLKSKGKVVFSDGCRYGYYPH